MTNAERYFFKKWLKPNFKKVIRVEPPLPDFVVFEPRFGDIPVFIEFKERNSLPSRTPRPLSPHSLLNKSQIELHDLAPFIVVKKSREYYQVRYEGSNSTYREVAKLLHSLFLAHNLIFSRENM